MQASDNITLARDIQQYGLKIKQLWLNGYDQTLLDQYSSLMQGVYLNNTANVPFEAADTAKFGNTYPGMQQYMAAMKQVRAGRRPQQRVLRRVGSRPP